jgi:hypothetical protein
MTSHTTSVHRHRIGESKSSRIELVDLTFAITFISEQKVSNSIQQSNHSHIPWMLCQKNEGG